MKQEMVNWASQGPEMENVMDSHCRDPSVRWRVRKGHLSVRSIHMERSSCEMRGSVLVMPAGDIFFPSQEISCVGIRTALGLRRNPAVCKVCVVRWVTKERKLGS